MPIVQREIDRFREFLQIQGLKLTGERTALLREIFATHYHFEADELLFRMKEKSLKISRATVYRTLELLVKSGMVRRIHLGEDHYHYEHVRGDSHHDHLICARCHKLVPIPCLIAGGDFAALERETGAAITFETTCRLDSETDVQYFRNGGVLPMVLRQLANA